MYQLRYFTNSDFALHTNNSSDPDSLIRWADRQIEKGYVSSYAVYGNRPGIGYGMVAQG